MSAHPEIVINLPEDGSSTVESSEWITKLEELIKNLELPTITATAYDDQSLKTLKEEQPIDTGAFEDIQKWLDRDYTEFYTSGGTYESEMQVYLHRRLQEQARNWTLDNEESWIPSALAVFELEKQGPTEKGQKPHSHLSSLSCMLHIALWLLKSVPPNKTHEITLTDQERQLPPVKELKDLEGDWNQQRKPAKHDFPGEYTPMELWAFDWIRFAVAVRKHRGMAFFIDDRTNLLQPGCAKLVAAAIIISYFNITWVRDTSDPGTPTVALGSQGATPEYASSFCFRDLKWIEKDCKMRRLRSKSQPGSRSRSRSRSRSPGDRVRRSLDRLKLSGSRGRHASSSPPPSSRSKSGLRGWLSPNDAE